MDDSSLMRYCDAFNEQRSLVFMFLVLQMLIFSLGKTLQWAVKDTILERGNLKSVLECMVGPDPATRASLMDLLDVSTLYLQPSTCMVLISSAASGMLWATVSLGLDSVYGMELVCIFDSFTMFSQLLRLMLCSVEARRNVAFLV
jgi:hypothetical protein